MANPLEINSYRRRHPNYMILNTNKDMAIGSIIDNDDGWNDAIENGAGALVNFGGKMLTSGLGVPGLNPYVSSIAGQLGQNQNTYATSPFINLNDRPFQFASIPYHDFRTRKITLIREDNFGKQLGKTFGNLLGKRIDGLDASTRGSVKGGIMAAAAATTGIYTLYNLDSVYGFGTHGAPGMRNDFTQKTMAGGNSKWDKKKPFANARLIKQRLTPFRGDKVNVIDYGKRSHQQIYQWLPRKDGAGEKLGKLKKFIQKATKAIGANPYGTTKDFIKFFFTGPNATIGNPDEVDDML